MGCWHYFRPPPQLSRFYGLFADPLSLNDHLRLISGFLPDGALEVIGDQVKRIAAHGQATLGFAFLGTLAFSLWGANAGTKSIFDALNIIFKERETRGFIKLTLWSLTFTIGAVGLALLSLVGIIAVPLALNFLDSPNNWKQSSSPFCAGHCSTLWCCSGSLASIAMALAAHSRNGGGSPGAAPLPAESGSPDLCCSRGMSRTSAPTTPPTARSEP
jgi:uncharacterized BrkB/YihY/UPF0761 family membrane protein